MAKKSNSTKQLIILPFNTILKENIIIIVGQKILCLFLNKYTSQEILVTHKKLVTTKCTFDFVVQQDSCCLLVSQIYNYERQNENNTS